MAEISVRATIDIARPRDVVWRQFGDIAHHAAAGVHHGVSFEVLSDDGTECHYRQTTSLGAIRALQQFVLVRTEGEPLVNRVVQGQFNGGSITFTVDGVNEEHSTVSAHLVAPLRGTQRLLGPVLRRSARRALGGALQEDKRDLESGNYN